MFCELTSEFNVALGSQWKHSQRIALVLDKALRLVFEGFEFVFLGSSGLNITRALVKLGCGSKRIRDSQNPLLEVPFLE